MKEKLIPVHSESELRAGMIVVLKRCFSCRGDHRFMLIRREPYDGESVSGRQSTCRWHEAPRIHGVNGWGLDLTAKDGRLFRVDDGLEDFSHENTCGKPVKKRSVLNA